LFDFGSYTHLLYPRARNLGITVIPTPNNVRACLVKWKVLTTDISKGAARGNWEQSIDWSNALPIAKSSEPEANVSLNIDPVKSWPLTKRFHFCRCLDSWLYLIKNSFRFRRFTPWTPQSRKTDSPWHSHHQVNPP
jgi:hypothetical protein